ncbi:MAG: crossover junction endodeoxyribonuclease RuvC [Spirochaetes bacterium GWF1_31_7]|nr:MAG: crossover junction endodeoxyribonuclease RuvC [Spirochaetes bacterium GWE1_32_154]OHD48406.1 MAG: crossover junction endodeoxyribonuclease RuvC [Spirochaetes bacterium GWE2_31_10]OHD50883.1 MAG: crossover junction endodeoxyribonuclease RuvC [Spirochaetes bacterium GWF1_31_7]OHD83070.1 MAG: crossover junction endodeoxyribonuclease RuvC [Spirochaetes bacterium RIFOXYB1_FULL_32_8]HBD96406.1 crossover junction endodeoxyribonuclease RuvC [Spirochaetia bacterium]
MITIGIDPGIERVGIGVVQYRDSRLKLLDSKLIKTSSKDSVGKRLQIIYDELIEMLGSYTIAYASVEEIFFAKNVKTVINVAQARGVILLALEKSLIPVYEYTPLQVKQALSGYGRADKGMMQRMLRMIIGDEVAILQDDVADGIALAITHINTNRIYEKIKG